MLKGRARMLYREKKYGELFDHICGTDEGINTFMELCRQDNDLCRWYAGFQKKMWDKVFGNPGLEVFFRAMADKQGFSDIFEFQKNIHTFGFATAEEFANVFGCTVEDIRETVAQNPELFREHVITIKEQ